MKSTRLARFLDLDSNQYGSSSSLLIMQACKKTSTLVSSVTRSILIGFESETDLNVLLLADSTCNLTV